MSTATHPIEWADLEAYLAHDTDADAAARLEDHVFQCAACADRLARLAAMVEGVRDWSRGARGGVTEALLARLAADGVHLRRYELEPGDSIQCTALPDDEIVVLRLEADLTGVERADLIAQVVDGPAERAIDLPIVEGRRVLVGESAAHLRPLPAHVTHLTLVAVEPAGERVVATYTLNHVPSTSA